MSGETGCAGVAPSGGWGNPPGACRSTGLFAPAAEPFAFRRRILHNPPTMQITTVAWLMQMRRRPRRVEDGVLGA
jgi:hypothetical protein